MAFTVTDSCAVNTLLDYLLGRNPAWSDRSEPPVTEEKARAAAAHLAEQARKTLAAGWHGQAVHRAWKRGRK